MLQLSETISNKIKNIFFSFLLYMEGRFSPLRRRWRTRWSPGSSWPGTGGSLSDIRQSFASRSEPWAIRSSDNRLRSEGWIRPSRKSQKIKKVSNFWYLDGDFVTQIWILSFFNNLVQLNPEFCLKQIYWKQKTFRFLDWDEKNQPLINILCRR